MDSLCAVVFSTLEGNTCSVFLSKRSMNLLKSGNRAYFQKCLSGRRKEINPVIDQCINSMF